MKKIRLTVLTICFLLVLITRATAQDLGDYTYYYNQGYAKLLEGSFQDSLSLFDRAIELKANCAEAFLGKGIAYRQLKQLDQALWATKKALEFDPGYYKAYYNLGLILEEQGDKKAALDAYTIFLSKVPEARNLPDLKEKIKLLKSEK